MGRQHQGINSSLVHQVPEGSGEQKTMEGTGYEITCGAPTTLGIGEVRRWDSGSQWSECKTGGIWFEFEALSTSLAAAFWTLCNLSRRNCSSTFTLEQSIAIVQSGKLVRSLIGFFIPVNHYIRITSGLKETFIKRQMAQRTSKSEIRPEEQSEKTESCREHLWNEIHLKGP